MFDLFNLAQEEEKKVEEKKVKADTPVETTTETVTKEAVAEPATDEVIVTSAEDTKNIVTDSKDKAVPVEKTEKTTPAKKEEKVVFEVDTAALVRYCGESVPLTDFFGVEEIQEGLTSEKVRKRLEADYPELVASHTEVLSIKKKNQIYIVPTLKAKKKGCTAEISQPIPYSILSHFERIAFQYAQNKLEVHADIYYCYERKQFILDVPQQNVSTYNCEVTEDMGSILERIGFDTKKVAEIHSHHYLRAVPSTTDDAAERVPGMNYFIIGEMQNASPTYFGRRFINDLKGWEILDVNAIFSKEGAK